jgi:hypothetical protein
MKGKMGVNQSMYEILQILSINSLNKVALNSLFEKQSNKNTQILFEKQLKLAIL